MEHNSEKNKVRYVNLGRYFYSTHVRNDTLITMAILNKTNCYLKKDYVGMLNIYQC